MALPPVRIQGARGYVTQPALVYPHPAGSFTSRPARSDLHETAGLPGNWALDFMAPGGTPVYCVQDHMTVERWSGHDPATGVHDGSVYGWNIYLRSPANVVYFVTHLGDREHEPGSAVHRGDVIGHVGHWPGDPARSHSHIGVTHPAGKVAAVARIVAVAEARARAAADTWAT